ncbi:MAG TPA: hypothetical protein VJN43_10965 [Bryobacteraceae bacterium]|nr:hypothetical protein [Bryobacteraceae bacterium]
MALRTWRALLLLVLAASLCDPPELSSCGPFIPQAVFTPARMPEATDAYAHGQLGVLQPGYTRIYLVIAYRYLAGIGLNDAERKALFGPGPQMESQWSAQQPAAVERWLAARTKVAGAGPAPKIDVFRQIRKQGYFSYYLNCSSPAFDTAVATLEDRARKFGAASPEVKTWLAAQDQVFANCSGAPAIPTPLDAGAHSLARADRAYQIAAANFYASDLERAETLFGEIAADHGSPWSGIAPYMIARTLVRRATLSVQGEGVDNGALSAAEKQLKSVLDDSSRRPVHPAATALLGYVEARLHPEERMRELAEKLVRKNAEANIQQDLTDYRYLYDQFEAGKYGGPNALPLSQDLTNWIFNFQGGGKDAADHAVDQWRSTHARQWLVAALAKADGKHAAASELVSAGGAVAPDSPGYATVEFHVIRILMEGERNDEARTRLDVLLKQRTLPASAVNLFRAERMKLARSWDEFLQYASRTATGVNDGRGEINVAAAGLPQDLSPKTPGFDTDSIRIINEQIPLNLLLDAARQPALPRPLRRRVALAAWTRAILLDDHKAAMELAPILGDLAPELEQPLRSYVEARGAEARGFAAVWLMLKSPGLQPYVRAGFSRMSPVGKRDLFHDNWWCSLAPDPSNTFRNYYLENIVLSEPQQPLYKDGAPQAHFLSKAEQEQGREEWSRLTKAPAAPEYLAAQTLEWAKAHPDDARVPEALHMVVSAGHYGCGKEKSPFSEQAFRLLHQKYPDSEWAKKTKYWY